MRLIHSSNLPDGEIWTGQTLLPPISSISTKR